MMNITLPPSSLLGTFAAAASTRTGDEAAALGRKRQSFGLARSNDAALCSPEERRRVDATVPRHQHHAAAELIARAARKPRRAIVSDWRADLIVGPKGHGGTIVPTAISAAIRNQLGHAAAIGKFDGTQGHHLQRALFGTAACLPNIGPLRRLRG